MTHKDYWDGFQAGLDAGGADGFKKGMRFVSSASCKAGYETTCRGGGLALPRRPELRCPQSKEAVIPDAITPHSGPSVPKLDLRPNARPGGIGSYSRLEPTPLGLEPLGLKSDPIFSTPVQYAEGFRPVASELHPPLGFGRTM